MPSSKDYLKRLDKEGSSFKKEMMPHVLKSDCTLKDIFGFKLAENKARADLFNPEEVRLRAVLPLYDEILIVIPPEFRDKKIFKEHLQFDPEEIALLAEKGRVILTFNSKYQKYRPEVIEPLLQPGIPHVSCYQWGLFMYFGLSKPKYLLPPLLGKKELPEFPEISIQGICFPIVLAHGFDEPLAEVLQKIREGSLQGYDPNCLFCFAMYAHRFLTDAKLGAVPIRDAPFCTKLNSLITEMAATKCIFSESFLGSPDNINDVAKGLKVSYSPEIALEDYVEIVDGKVTRAIRRNMNRILEDPLSIKYKQRLYSKIYELNKEVEEISKSKLTSIGVSTTDIMCYNLKKHIPYETIRKGIDWLSSVSLGMQAKLLKRDWAVLQLYRVRRRLEKAAKTNKKANKKA
jgi:hypothetical protein